MILAFRKKTIKIILLNKIYDEYVEGLIGCTAWPKIASTSSDVYVLFIIYI